MKRHIIIILTLFVFLCVNEAKSINVMGEVIDRESNSPLLGATIRLFENGDTIPIGGSKTGKDGKFKIEIKQAKDDLYITASMIGYETQAFYLKSYQANPDIKIGKIKMSISQKLTDQVEVYAARDLFTSETDKMVVNVDKMLTTSGGSAVEVLKNVPQVKVDLDNNVTLRGSSNVKVLVDGRQSGLDNAEILEQLPSESIEKIEVITNPGSKFDAEGGAGIINVILKKKRPGGFAGMLSANVGNYNRNSAALNLNYRADDFNIFGSYNLRLFGRDGTNNMTRIFYDDSPNPYIFQTGEVKRRFNGNTFRLGADYYINENHSLTFSSSYSIGIRRPDDTTFFKVFDRDSLPAQYFGRNTISEMTFNNFDINLGYRSVFEKNKEEISVDVQISPTHYEPYREYAQTNFSTEDMKIIGTQDRYNSETESNSQRLSANMDYYKIYTKERKIELGMKSDARTSEQDYVFNNYNNTVNNWEKDTLKSNDFVYDEYIHAIYGSFMDAWGDFSFKLGLRGEYTYTRGDQRTINLVHKEEYFSLFPSVHLQYAIFETDKVGISYSRRIRRPWSRIVNPFIDYSDPLNLDAGNPKIKPSFTDAFEISNNIVTEKAMFNTSLYYNETKDVISDIQRVYSPGVLISTHDNIAQKDDYGVNVFASYQFTKWFRLDGSFNYYASEFNSDDTDLVPNSKSSAYFGSVNAETKVFDWFSLQLNAYYSSPTNQGQYEEKSQYYINMGLRSDFKLFDNDASLTFSFSDLFKTLKYGETYTTTRFKTIYDNDNATQFISLGFTYRINDFKRVKERRDSSGEEME